MIVRYNRNRTFRVWEANGKWYGVESKNIMNGKLTVPFKECLSADSKDGIVDRIEERCRFDELVANGMNRMEAASAALFGD